MIVITVTTPLSSVDDAFLVITVGEGVVVTAMVVGTRDVTIDGWEGLCDEDWVDELVLLEEVEMELSEEGEVEQLAKSVETGSTSVMILVMIRGFDTVETPPMQPSIRLYLEIKSTNAKKSKARMEVDQILPDHSPGITVVSVISVEETQIPVTVDRHEEDTSVEVVSGNVCRLVENVVTTTVEVTVVNKVRVGVGVHAAMSCR